MQTAYAKPVKATPFIAFVPNKHLSMTAAYVNLGQIADKNDQEALYVSVSWHSKGEISAHRL